MKYIEYKNYFFVGIGGIGMSALAKYLFQNNKTIYGYDRVCLLYTSDAADDA